VRNLFLMTAFGMSAAFFLTSAEAAIQGSTGTTSTGQVQVQIIIPALVNISGLTDITIPTPTNFSVPATGQTTACVYTNSAAATPTYAVTATSANSGGGTDFFVKNGPSSTLKYTATWTNTGSTPGPVTLASGVKVTGRTGANNTSTTCASGGPSSNATFAVSFAAADMQLAPDGTYTDTATIVISPT
jgi:hypothetical protein